ncbi:Protein CBG21982 [Caenorhabditis briggsae]|uniref:Protein CBG21982 n=1 Tax=Caenorhabditis briggsae TaxID=6238 RepID=A8Y132_CAEBR|nr:Protein CBG21982 [Caenorhabditis briggsae]CAP38593.2 Protein CBG21982 [Caenorhabditis briggsae]
MMFGVQEDNVGLMKFVVKGIVQFIKSIVIEEKRMWEKRDVHLQRCTMSIPELQLPPELNFPGKSMGEIVDSLRSTFDEVTILRIFGEDQRQDEIQYILDNMKHTNQLEYLEMNLRNLEDCVEVAMKDIPYEIRHSIPTP